MPADAWTNGLANPIARADLRELLKANTPLVIPSPATVPATTLAGIKALICEGRPYFYDPADTISAHDGFFALVSSDGKVFKLGREAALVDGVLALQNTPPGSPAIGDAYLIGLAPTGAWAANAEALAVYTVNGWRFIAPLNLFGRVIYVEAEDASYQMTASGWRKGLGASGLSAGNIRGSHFYGNLARAFLVENTTTNTPPASPADALAWVIGPSPTGVWAGKGGWVASRESGGWVYYQPVEGWQVWDKSADQTLIFNGSSWQNPISNGQAVVGRKIAYYNAYGPKTVVGIGNGSTSPQVYSYSDTGAPIASQRRWLFSDIAITYAAKEAGANIILDWDGLDLPTDGTYAPTVAIFQDSDTSAICWTQAATRRVIFAAPDTAPHVYALAIMTNYLIGRAYSIPKFLSFSLTEVR